MRIHGSMEIRLSSGLAKIFAPVLDVRRGRLKRAVCRPLKTRSNPELSNLPEHHVLSERPWLCNAADPDPGRIPVVHQLVTPFRICWEASLEACVQTFERGVRFFDDGLNLHTLLSLGVSFEEEAEWNRLQDAFPGTGVVLHSSGLIEMIAPRKRAEKAYARYLLALSQLTSWPADAAFPMNRDRKEYVARAVLAFRCVLHKAEIECFPVVQTSGGEISFDHRMDDKYVDVLSMASVRSHIRKVEALRLERLDVQTLSVVNDVADASGRAVAELETIGSPVPAMLLSALEASALRLDRHL